MIAYRKHMTRAKADEIRAHYFSRRHKQVELAKLYGISQGNISQIISGKLWAKN